MYIISFCNWGNYREIDRLYRISAIPAAASGIPPDASGYDIITAVIGNPYRLPSLL